MQTEPKLPLSLLAVLLFARSVPAEPGELTLVRNGKPTSVIVIPSEWVLWQKLAADELQYHLKRMSGATVPIVHEDKYRERPGKVTILVAQSELLTELGIDTTKLKPETLIVKVIGNTLVLAGEDGTQEPRLREPFRTDIPLHSIVYGIRNGSLFAVYELLHEALGCRWVFPGDIGAVIPKRSTVKVPADLNIQRTPKLAQRHFRPFLNKREKTVKQYDDALWNFPDLMKVYDQVSDDEALWMLRLRLGRNYYFPYGHAFTQWWDKYGRDKPIMPKAAGPQVTIPLGDGEEGESEGEEDELEELDDPDAEKKPKKKEEVKMKPGRPSLFALLPDGSRGCQKGGSPEYVKMCVTNPELWDLLIKEFRNHLAARPDVPVKVLNICENDGGSGFCTCEKCRAWDISRDGKPRMQGKNTVLSARYARFFNEMAKRVREVDPEAWVMGYAYSWYQPAPRTVDVAANAIIGLSEFSRYPMKPSSRAHARRQHVGWSRGGARMILRPNAFCYFNGRLPFVVTHEMADDLKFMIEHNLWGTDFDGFFAYWATSGPTYYVLARMLWDTDADVKELLDEYYRAFGPMSAIVKEYFDFWEERTLKRDLPADEAIVKGQAILDKAAPLLEKADLEDVERFKNIQFGLTHCKLMREARRPKEGEDKEKLLAAAKRLMGFRHEIVARNVTNVFWLTMADVRSRGTYVREVRYPRKASDTEDGKPPVEEPPKGLLDTFDKEIDGGLLD